MEQKEGSSPPINVIESAALLFITRTLQQTDMVAVLATDVARYYASHGIVAVLPPASLTVYGKRLDPD